MAKLGRKPKYKEEYCQMVIDHMAKGHSFESFGAVVDCDRRKLREWAKKYPAFGLAEKCGHEKNLMLLERLGMAGMTGKIKGWNTGMWMFMMKNRHRDLYSDRHEVTVGVADSLAAIIGQKGDERREAIDVTPMPLLTEGEGEDPEGEDDWLPPEQRDPKP